MVIVVSVIKVNPPPYYFANYQVFTSVPCFLEGTQILTDKGYIPIQYLQKDTLIQTYLHGLLPLSCLGYSKIYNPSTKERFGNRLFKLTPTSYPDLEEDLIITGNHCVLVDDINADKKEKMISKFSSIPLNQEMKQKLNQLLDTNYHATYKIDDKYCLLAHLDSIAEPYTEEGVHTIWHLALESDNDTRNFGIYANGLLVEAASKEFLMNHSNMTLKN